MLLPIVRSTVLLVGDLLHPVDDLAVEFLLDRDMRHGGGRRSAMPMLFAGRAQDHVARSNHLDRAAPALHQSAARRDDQRLPQRMRVPIAPRARLECHVGAARACRRRRLEELVNTHSAGEIFGGSSRGGLCSVSFEFHWKSPLYDARSALWSNCAWRP